MSNTKSVLDQYMTVRLSEDKLAAYLLLTPVQDPPELTLPLLNSFLASHEIVYGILQEECRRIVNDPKSYYHKETMIASGNEAIPGTDARIHYHYELGKKTSVPSERTDGSVDFKQLNSVNNVLKGELIAEIIEATEGVSGKTVTGETIAGKDGKRVHFKIGKNVVTNPEKTKLYAVIDGLVTKTDKDRINVFPVYEVNGDVDYSVGNIDFVGNVVIRGNVISGFRVKAVGDIRVIGGVEGAELYAEGSIVVTEGIIGQHKGSIKAGKNVESSFIQDGDVDAGEDVIVSQSIMHSRIKAAKNIICQGSKGLIVGGLLQAGEKISARIIGNTMSTLTNIEVGVVPHLRNELMQLREHIKVENDKLTKTNQALQLLDQLFAKGQLDAEKLELRGKLNVTRKSTEELIQKAKERVLEIEKSLVNTESARVEVQHTVYAGTKIVLGHYTKYIKDTLQRCSFIVSEGEIKVESIR